VIEAIRREIRARGAELGFHGEPSVLQVGGASWRGGRVHFAIAAPNGAPSLFARVNRNPADAPRLAAERELLGRLAASAHFAVHVPTPMFFSEVAGRSLLCERAVTGRRLASGGVFGLSATALSRGLSVAKPLAIELARAAAEGTTRERFEELALNPLRSFWLSAGGAAREIDPLLSSVLDALGRRPRFVVTHGDFIAKNIQVERDGRAVLIDWETATPHGLPLLDLFYFISRQAYLAGPRWRKKIDRVRRFYAEPSDANQVARLAAQHYCTALDLPTSLIVPMQRLHFLYKARIKAETTSLDNAITLEWLELFAGSLRGELDAS
jgi:hypothetical protein